MGIFNKRTLIGVGDANNGRGNNAEMVTPLDVFWKELGNQFDRQNRMLANNNNNSYSNRPVVISLNVDGKTLARQTVSSMEELAKTGQLNLEWF